MRIAKAGIIMAVVIALLPVIYLTAEHCRGRALFHKELQKAQARGLISRAMDLAPRPPAPEDNAASELQSSTLTLSQETQWLLRIFRTITFDSSQNLRVALWQLTRIPITTRTTMQWSQFRNNLVNSNSMLPRIRIALARPCYHTGFPYALGMFLPSDAHQKARLNLPNIPDLEVPNTLLALSVNCSLHENDLSTAMDDLVLLVRFSTTLLREPLVPLQIVRRDVISRAMETTWSALQHPDWTPGQLDRLQSAWEGCDLVNDMIDAVKMRQAMTLELYDRLEGSNDALLDYLGCFPDNPFGLPKPAESGSTICIRRIYPALWRFAYVDMNRFLSLENHQKQIDILQSHATSDTSDFYWELKNPPVPYRFVQARFFVANSRAVTEPPTDVFLSQTCYEITRTAIALERFKHRKGQYPASLNALAPEFLPGIPEDPINRAPLVYKRITATRYLLYSLGVNGTDDGGASDSISMFGDTAKLVMAPDIVWPQLPEESSTNSVAHY
jgi:hypothetical protein